jgi:hypothetical protein
MHVGSCAMPRACVFGDVAAARTKMMLDSSGPDFATPVGLEAGSRETSDPACHCCRPQGHFRRLTRPWQRSQKMSDGEVICCSAVKEN